jgi:hypothetical protein
LHIDSSQARNWCHKRIGKTGWKMETSFRCQRDRSISPLRPLWAQPGQSCQCRCSQNVQRESLGVQKTSPKANFLIQSESIFNSLSFITIKFLFFY